MTVAILIISRRNLVLEGVGKLSKEYLGGKLSIVYVRVRHLVGVCLHECNDMKYNWKEEFQLVDSLMHYALCVM